MTGRIYKTAQGKMVDMGALILQNEHERAVGNMKVNARGDIIDADNQPIVPRDVQSNKNYQVNTSNAPVHASNKAANEAAQRAEQERLAMEARAARQAKREAVAQGATIPTGEKPLTGLAAAMAAAKSQPDEE